MFFSDDTSTSWISTIDRALQLSFLAQHRLFELLKLFAASVAFSRSHDTYFLNLDPESDFQSLLKADAT